MRLRHSIVLALFAASTATAANLELKGFKLGLPEPELDAIVPGLAKNCLWYDEGSLKMCSYRTTTKALAYSRGRPDEYLEALRTLGGAVVGSWKFGFRDHALSDVRISMHANWFEQVVGALREKYGPENVKQVGTVKNRMGADLPWSTLRWDDGQQLITVERVDDAATVQLITHRERAKQLEDEATRAKKGASDL